MFQYFQWLKEVTDITCVVAVYLFAPAKVCEWNENSSQNHSFTIQTTQANPVESFLRVIKIPLDLNTFLSVHANGPFGIFLD